MIQTGDPDSKNAPKGAMLGSGDPDYQLDAEFVYPRHFHKRGALAAARQGDQVNPEKKIERIAILYRHRQDLQ